MARKQKQRRRRPSAPAPRQPAPRRPVGVPTTAVVPVAGTTEEDLGAMYAHVKRDLTRIAITALLLLAVIIGSQFVL